MARTVAERIAKLEEIRDSLEDRLAEMLTRPRPSYNVDGQEFSHTQYQEFLLKAIKDTTDLIADVADTDEDGGQMIATQVFTG